MILPRRIFDLYWGQSGAGKSRAAAQVILAVHKLTGKKARVVIGDGSLASYDALIDAGIVEAVEFAHRPWPMDVVKRLSEGWFPVEDNPLGPLVPPSAQPSFKDIEMYVFEGASVMGSYVMGTNKGGLAALAGEGVKIGQDTPFRIVAGTYDNAGKLIDGPGTVTGGNSMAHYGPGQRAIIDAAQTSKGLGRYVIWTAHEAINDPDKDAFVKELTVGPEVVGKKWISGFQRIFNAALHFQSVAKRGRVVDDFTGKPSQELDLDYRLWTRDHFSPDQNMVVRYKAVVRGLEHSDDIKDYYPGIGEFYAAHKDAQRKTLLAELTKGVDTDTASV